MNVHLKHFNLFAKALRMSAILIRYGLSQRMANFYSCDPRSSLLFFLFSFARILTRQTNKKIATIVTNVTASITQTIVCTCSLSGKAIAARALLACMASNARIIPVTRLMPPPFSNDCCCVHVVCFCFCPRCTIAIISQRKSSITSKRTDTQPCTLPK